MVDEISFDEFYRNFGFKAYPFNSFTAEDERDRQPYLFVSTTLYSPLFEAFESGGTMILSGDRGTGKTSITLDFVRRAAPEHLVCEIDDYRPLEKGFSAPDLYRFALTAMVNGFFHKVPNITKMRKSLSDDERLLLTYYYLHFAADATRGLAARTARGIQISTAKRWLHAVYNFLRLPLNTVTNVGVNIVSDVVAKSAGSTTEISAKVTEYFPEIAIGVESKFPDAQSTLEALRRFVTLANKVGFTRVVLILDKIDEDPRLLNDAEDIAEFISPILTDNSFLLDKSFQVVVSLWSVPLNFLKARVRTQKVYSPEVVWDYSDLQAAYNRRVKVFSGGNPLDFSSTFDSEVSESLKGELLDLSNRNPRDFWHLMNAIFRSQYRKDARQRRITTAAIEDGMTEFVKKFNFYEYYPRKSNARQNSMDVYAYIRHLLKLESASFTRNQLNEKAGTGSSTQNYTVGMENLGLIEKEASDKGEVRYRIRDPKVRFALEKRVEILQN